MKKKLLITLIFSFCHISFAQGEGAFPFLDFQQSIMYSGSGGIGVTDPAATPAGFYFNPASLGRKTENNFSTLFFTPRQESGNKYFSPTFRNFGLRTSYDFSKNSNGLPFTFGVGILYSKFDYGRYSFRYNNEHGYIEVEPYDSFLMMSFGIGYKYFAEFSFGASLKYVDSDLGDIPTENEPGAGKVDLFAFDFGVLVDIPFTKITQQHFTTKLDQYTSTYPTLDLSIGLSTMNIGGKVDYGFGGQEDPILRTARLGYTFKFGYDLQFDKSEFSLINYSFTGEASDVLITSRRLNDSTFSKFEYQGILSDLQFTKNLIKLEGSSKIISHKAHILNLFETITFTSGRFFGKGFREIRKSHSFSLSTKGIFKLLNNLTENESLIYITNHFELSYTTAIFNEDTAWESDLYSFALSYKGFQF